MGDELIVICKIALEILVISAGVCRGDNLCRGMPERTGNNGGILHGKVVCHQSRDQQDCQNRIPDPAEGFVAHALFGLHK